MMLSAQMFRQIVDALKSDAARDKDKRTAPRVGLRAQVTIVSVSGERRRSRSGVFNPIRVRCRNLSASGIGLLHSSEIRSGAEFVVRLDASRLETPVHISCVVVHCNKLSSDLFSIGARIIRVLSEDEVNRLAAMAA
jgi:hypothetical protein